MHVRWENLDTLPLSGFLMSFSRYAISQTSICPLTRWLKLLMIHQRALSLALISYTQMLLCLHQCVIIRRAKRLIEFIWLSIGSNARVRYGKFNWNKCGIESTNKLTLRTEMKEDRNSEARHRKRVARCLTEEYGIIRPCMLMSHYPTTTKSEIDVMS